MEKELDKIDDARKLIQQEQAVLLYFYNDHCAPCISLRPKVTELISQDFPKVKLAFINSEKHPEFSAEFGVYENPVLMLFFDGREQWRGSKYISIASLKETIDRPYRIIFSE
jgi:thioredoxin-like negative regulator of GroEL